MNKTFRNMALTPQRSSLSVKSCSKWILFRIRLKKKFPLFILDRGEGREKKRERNINVWVSLTHPPTGELTWPATQACALTGKQTGDPLICRLALNPLSPTSQGRINLLVFLNYEYVLFNFFLNHASYRKKKEQDNIVKDESRQGEGLFIL